MSIVEAIKEMAKEKGQVWEEGNRKYWKCGLFSVVRYEVPVLNYEELRNEEDGSRKDSDRNF